jgi:hypothetical protein
MTRPPRLLGLLGLLIALSAPRPAAADEPPDAPPGDSKGPARPGTASGSANFSGVLQTLRGPASAGAAPLTPRGPEIFPDASRVWMSVRDTDPAPVEAARQGGPWLCSAGPCAVEGGSAGQSAVGDGMLRSIKLQTPTLALPLTIWGRLDEHGERVLDFDPVLLGRRSYGHVCAYRPVDAGALGAPGGAPGNPQGGPTAAPNSAPGPRGGAPSDRTRPFVCHDGIAPLPPPDAAELILGFEWPKQSELADFHYLAIVDSCGNARVQPFQRTFTAPAFEVASGGCGQADGKVLRVFPQGGFLRITAFNLDAPAAGNVVNATYRVSLPPLENGVDSSPARLLFPDPLLEELKVDCGPPLRRSPEGAPSLGLSGGLEIPPGAASSSPAPSGAGPVAGERAAVAPAGRAFATSRGATASARIAVTAASPLVSPGLVSPSLALATRVPSERTPGLFPVGPGPQPLAHEAVVIAPEPLRQGSCRLRLLGQAKRRLVAPLALYVSLTRTDRSASGAPIELLTDGRWIVTPSAAEFQLPPLSENFDGDSRLRLTVSSDPLGPGGKVVLLSDAGRVASALKTDGADMERARRLIGSVIIHSVPLCGSSNFEAVESVGSCVRAYITVPALVATLQVTRAPWVERPLLTRSVLSAVGVALAIDSYNPVERRAFPVAAQIGGFVESLGDGRVGLLGYVGVAPTIPILGSGGNTTSFGFLGGIGLAYITNEAGPDEGLKPAAFLGLVVQVGQATPTTSGSASGGVSALAPR